MENHSLAEEHGGGVCYEMSRSAACGNRFACDNIAEFACERICSFANSVAHKYLAFDSDWHNPRHKIWEDFLALI